MFLGQFFVIVNLIVPRILAQIDPNFEFLIFETSSIQIYKKNLRIRSSLDICVRSNLDLFLSTARWIYKRLFFLSVTSSNTVNTGQLRSITVN